MTDSVTIAIPETGRMAQETLEWLAQKGAVSQEWAAKAAEAIGNVRKRDNETAAKDDLLKRWSEGLEGITIKYDLRSGWRVAVSAAQSRVGTTPVVVYGSSPPTITGIREGLAEVAVIGFDDLVATMVPYFANRTADGETAVALSILANPWTTVNYKLSSKNITDVRVLGATGMNDYAGLCLLVSEKSKSPEQALNETKEGKLPVYVKGRYQGLAYYLLGDKIDARATERIEEAVNADNAAAIDIVRTGETVLKNQLLVIGRQLMVTKSVVAVDITRYNADKNVKTVADMVVRNSPGADLDSAVAWRRALENKLGSSWVRE